MSHSFVLVYCLIAYIRKLFPDVNVGISLTVKTEHIPDVKKERNPHTDVKYAIEQVKTSEFPDDKRGNYICKSSVDRGARTTTTTTGLYTL